jgi:hypothetical protein
MGPGRVSRLNLSIGLTREGTVSEKNGDKARFGRDRQRKILRRKRTGELRKALEMKEQATQASVVTKHLVFVG